MKVLMQIYVQIILHKSNNKLVNTSWSNGASTWSQNLNSLLRPMECLTIR